MPKDYQFSAHTALSCCIAKRPHRQDGYGVIYGRSMPFNSTAAPPS